MEDRELTFWEHLDVLRWALARIVGLWFVLAIGFFIAMPYIFDPVIMGPCHDNFVFYGFLRKIGEVFNLTGDFFTQRFDIKLQNINLAAPFFVHLTTSFVLSIVILVPYIFWEIWMFIRPALYPNEAAGVSKALLLGNVMFYIGMAVGYFMVYPLALRFLATYDLSDNIDTLISLNSYIDNFMMLTLAMGIAFELPLVTWLLSLFGLLTRSTLREYRRHAIVVIVIASAIITPTGDPFTLTAVALPLYALYELSIFMIKEQKDEDEEESELNKTNSKDKPDGPKPALEKKPDGGGSPDAPDAEAKQIKPEERNIKETFRLQREAAEQAKIEAKNKALQERIDKAAVATTVTGAAIETTEAADGTVKELTANTEPSVKDALAEAKEATAEVVKKKKKIREPRMVIINDEIYWEEGPEIEVDDDEPSPEEQKAEEQPKTSEQQNSKDLPQEEKGTAGNTSVDASEEVTTEASPEEVPTEVSTEETPMDTATEEVPADTTPTETPVEDSSWENPYQEEVIDKPEALQTPYYDDPEAMPDLSNYYAESQRQIAEDEVAEALTNIPKDVASLAEAIPSSPSASLSSSTNDIVEQARLAAENARKAAEQAVKAAQEAARIAEETAKAAEQAAKAAAEEAAKAAANPLIDVSGIRYDYGRYTQ
ncbi:MAG: twin-arginine translocase subunit TatC [Bacteroidaceae bacterium]|nr:twin-arginine translocase subunit TatC [Bacteroidaceae bacterium]